MNIPGRKIWDRLGPRSKLLLRLVLSLGIVAALIISVDIGELASVLGGVTWSLAIPTIIGLTAMHLIGVTIWRVISVRLTGITFRWGFLTRAYYSALAMGSLTPSNIGADVYRAYAVNNGTNNWKEAFLPIAIQRALSYLGLLLLGILAISLAPLPPAAVKAVAILAGFFIVGIICFLILVRSSSSANSVTGRLSRKLQIPSAWAILRTKRLWATAGFALLLTLIFHMGSVSLSYTLFLAAGGEGQITEVFSILMLARLVIILPLPMSSLGFQEGALVVLFMVIGIPAEIGLAVSILNRLAFFQTVALGAVLLSTGKIRLEKKYSESISSVDRYEDIKSGVV